MRRFATRTFAALALAPALLAPTGAAAAPGPFLPPEGKVMIGLTGTFDLSRFARQVGLRPGVFGHWSIWAGDPGPLFESAARNRTRLMLHVGTSRGYGFRGVVSPRGIARGRGDGYLLRTNALIAAHGSPVYVRLMAEMNQANNAYSAFDADGTSRGPTHSTREFRRAWRRSALILRGGSVAGIDRRLRRLNMPPVRGVRRDAVLARPDVAMLWVPQTAGTPDIRANRPQAYWPGARYVDWVGTDFYSRFPNFAGLDAFYAAFPGKPFVFGEWAMWGGDDPRFVRRFFGWIRSHPRVRMIVYNQGMRAGGPFRLRAHPRARAEIRAQLRDKRFTGSWAGASPARPAAVSNPVRRGG